MATDTTDEDPFTELVDAHIPRVDLVDKAANGMSFLIAKGAQGLFDPAFVRELIAKSEPEKKETVTMTGSPGAIAKLIHEAARKHADEPADIVAKDAELDESADGMNVTVPLAAPDEEAPGDPGDPGSPAWEAIDAATARKWTAILARAGRAIGLLAERETLEAAGADPDDITNAWDLEDAGCAINYAISVLAPFAVAEQSEADCGADMMAAVGKTLADFDATPLDTIEVLSPLAKAGRVLSAGNEAAIRGAVEELQKVLASLPSAPTTEESGQSVAKTANEEPTMAEPTVSEDVTAASGQEPAMGTQQAEAKPVAGLPVADMAKADGDKPEVMAVFDAKGKLVGIVDPTKVTTVSGASIDDETPADEPGQAPAPETADLTPAPAAEVGTPADAVPDDEAVTKQTDTTSEEVLKSIAETAAAAALNQFMATQEPVAKGDFAQLTDLVETLKGQVKALEEQPAMPKVFSNGAQPRDLRGMDQGTTPAQVDVTKAAELKKQLYNGQNAGEQQQAFLAMQEMAINQLAAMRAQQ